MKFELYLTARAKGDFASLSGSTLERITRALEKISMNPYIGKFLKGELQGLHSYRTGNYRIIYEVVKAKIVIIVLKIGHRKDVYR